MFRKFFGWVKRMVTKQTPKKLVEWKGKGNIIARDFKAESNFALEFYIGRQGMLFFEADMFSQIRKDIKKKKLKEFSFNGEFDNGVRLSIDRLILIGQGDIINGEQMPLKLKVFSEISVNRNDFKASHEQKILFRVANLAFTGCEKTFTAHGGWSIDHFTINIDGYPIEVRRLKEYKDLEKEVRKGKVTNAETAQIIVIAKHTEHKNVLKVINDLCWLMSFATGNTVVPFGEIHLDGKKIAHESYRNMRTEPFKFDNHVIPEMPSELLPQFLEETYPNYKKYKKELGMDVILNYYELMRRNPIMDVRCVLGYVLLEALSNNAQEYYNKKKDPVKNSMLKSKEKKLKKILPEHKIITDEVIENLKKEFIYPHPSLQDSINKLMKEFKMKYEKNEDKLFGLRKDFIHKGKFQDGVPPVETSNKLFHFIDRLILHILRYTKEYLDISDGYKHKKLEYK